MPQPFHPVPGGPNPTGHRPRHHRLVVAIAYPWVYFVLILEFTGYLLCPSKRHRWKLIRPYVDDNASFTECLAALAEAMLRNHLQRTCVGLTAMLLAFVGSSIYFDWTRGVALVVITMLVMPGLVEEYQRLVGKRNRS